MTLTAIAMTNFISLNQLADKLDRTVEQVETDIEDYGIPLYRNNGSYGLTVEDTESYINNLFHIQAKQVLESIYLSQSEEYKSSRDKVLRKESKGNLSKLPEIENKPSEIGKALIDTINNVFWSRDFEIPAKSKKTNTKECLRDILAVTDNYNNLLRSLVTKEEGTQVFIENLATKLKHHRSKTIEPKVEEINKAILELWAEIKA